MKIFGTTKLTLHWRAPIYALMLLNTLILENAMAEIEVQGHRGARSVLPENTLPAFEYALEIGVDTLELDLGVSKDGVVVVVHDQKINPLICQFKNGDPINEDLWIHELSLEQIKNIDCGSKINPRFPKQQIKPGTEIPSLKEVFQLVQDWELKNDQQKVLFNIETKSNPDLPHAQPQPAEFVNAVLAVIDEFDLHDRVCIQSFDHRTLIEAHRLAPQILRSALFEDSPQDWVLATQQAKAQIVSPNFRLLDAQAVNSIHQAGLRVIPWTANTIDEWQALIELGVDGIISDDPQPLLQYLGRANTH